MTGDHHPNIDDGLRPDPSRSVLPKIDVAVVQRAMQQMLLESSAAHTTKNPAVHAELRFLPPTAAAGQLKQRSPSPPPFRAGFSYERASTPDLVNRRKEQQRLAQHKAFTASQPCYRKKQVLSPAAADEADVVAEPAVVTGARPGDPSAIQAGSSNGATAAEAPNCPSSSLTGAVENSSCQDPQTAQLAASQSDPTSCSRTAQPTNSSSGSTASVQQAASSSGSATIVAAEPLPSSTQQPSQTALPLPPPPPQQQQPSQQPAASLVPSGVPTSSSSTSPRKQQLRGSSTGYGSSLGPGPPSHPVVGSQGLLYAMAGGYSKQALDSFLSESLAMLPTAAGAAGTNPDQCRSPSSSPQQGSTATFNRNITVKLPNSNRSAAAAARRALGDAGAVAGVGRVTGSRPGSSAAYRSSRRLGGTARESDAFSEDFPSLDSPVIHPGFSLGHVAASLGASIQQLRQVELQQSRQQQQQSQAAAPRDGQATSPPKQQQLDKKPAGGKAAAAPAAADGSDGTALKSRNKRGDRSSISGPTAADRKEDPNRQSQAVAQDAAEVTGVTPAATKKTKTVTVAAAADAARSAAGKGLRGGASAGAGSQGTAAANGQVSRSQAAGGTVKLQGRTLTAAPDVMEGHTHLELLLTQAFGPTGASQQQQQDAGAASSNSTSTAGVPSWPAAAAVPGQVGTSSVSVDPVLAQFGGRRSPARDRVLKASQDKQQQWQQQQERLQPGRRGTAAAAAAVQLDRGCLAAEGSGAWGASSSNTNNTGSTNSTMRQQQLRRHSLTPEPYLYSRESMVGQGDSSSSSAGGYKGTAGLPLLPRGAAAAAGCEAHQGLLRDCAGAQLQQLACSITTAVNMQAAAVAAGTGSSTAATAVGDAGEAGGAGAAGDRGRVQGGSALGLQGGEVERLIARYHLQGRDADMQLYPTTFNLDHALASRQQVQALAAAIPQLPDLRLLLLRNNGLKERDLQTIAAALLNPSCCMVCGLDLGFNQLGPDAPLLLLPVLHKPPQMMMQARRRSTCEAGDSEGSPNRSQNPSCAGAKTLPHVSSTSSGFSQGSSKSGGTAAASSSSGGGANWRAPVASSIEGGSRLQYTEQAGGFRLQQTQQQLLPPPSFGHAMLLQLVLCSNPIGDAGAEAVCRVVGTGDCMLQLLDLSGCGVTERLSGCLKGMLEGARQLKVLRLGWNMLGVKSAKALAEGLKYCSSGLEQLYLPWSGITDTGASHIAKALESNSSVKLIDMSGCQVSAGTCVVLAETLSSNTALAAVILQDNPLSTLGVQKLLKAVHEGHVRHVDIAGCSFLAAPTHQLSGTNSSSSSAAPHARPSSKKGKKGNNKSPGAAPASSVPSQPKSASSKSSSSSRKGGSRAASAAAAAARAGQVKQIGGQAGSAASAFSVREPDGCYTLDLALPSDRQVAVELLKLTEDHGLDAWVGPTLNKKPFSITGVTKQSLPSQGILTVTFVAKHRLSWEAQPLTEPEFHSMWTQQVLPRATPSRPSLLLQQQEPQVLLPASDQWAVDSGLSWVGAKGVELEGSLAGSGMRVRAVSDGWKLELLQVLIQDCYFTSAQAGQIVAAFSYGEDKVEAAVKVFGRVVDPENFADQAYLTMNAWQIELADSRIGCLRLFSPDNPTGKYSLLLSHPAQRLVGVRLVELFCQQHIEGLCSFPHSVCFTSASLDDKPLPADSIQDPLRIRLPKSGIFKVCFVDLRPVPPAAKAVSPEGFAVLISMLTGLEKLDGWDISQAVDAAGLETKVSVVGRFETFAASHGPFTGKVGVLRRLHPDAAAVRVLDTAGFVEAIHIFAIHHHLTGAQLLELLKLLPEASTDQRVELCSRFWARLTDRAKTWSDVMRVLMPEQQVVLSHRLGLANVFDPVRPSMHYKLRMWRADEHQIAWRLHRMALNATHEAFVGFSVDGKQKKIAQTANLWALMRGSAADTDTPTVTLEFEFVWQDNLLPQWAAVTIQSAWRAYLIRKAAPPPVVRLRFESVSGRQPHHALGVRASAAGGKSGQVTHRSRASTQRSFGAGHHGRPISPGGVALMSYRSSVAGLGTHRESGAGQFGQQREWDLLLKPVTGSSAGGLLDH